MTDATTYGKILGRNIAAARGGLRLSQSGLAARMRELGFPWQQQTVAAVEKATRRPAAEEILGLALAMQTTIAALMTASERDDYLELPNGKWMGAVSLERLAGRGVNDRTVRWAADNTASYIALRRLPGADPFDPELLSQPLWQHFPPGTEPPG